MHYDGVTLQSSRVGPKTLKTIEFSVSDDTYYLLEQMANYNGINMPHLIRTIVEQKLKL